MRQTWRGTGGLLLRAAADRRHGQQPRRGRAAVGTGLRAIKLRHWPDLAERSAIRAFVFVGRHSDPPSSAVLILPSPGTTGKIMFPGRGLNAAALPHSRDGADGRQTRWARQVKHYVRDRDLEQGHWPCNRSFSILRFRTCELFASSIPPDRTVDLALCNQVIQDLRRKPLAANPTRIDKRKCVVVSPCQRPLRIEPRPTSRRIEVELRHLKSRALTLDWPYLESP